MNRKEALAFIKENSSLIRTEKFGEFIINHRIGSKSQFIILDMGQHGFQIYYPDGVNKISDTLEIFKNKVGIY